VLDVGEVAAEVLAGAADGPGDAGHGLLRADLVAGAGDARLAEVLGGDDVGGELAPALGDLEVLELEDGGAVGIADLGRAALPLDPLIGVDAGRGVDALELEALAAGRKAAGLAARIDDGPGLHGGCGSSFPEHVHCPSSHPCGARRKYLKASSTTIELTRSMLLARHLSPGTTGPKTPLPTVYRSGV